MSDYKFKLNVYQIEHERRSSIGSSYSYVLAPNFAVAEQVFKRDGHWSSHVVGIKCIGENVLLPELMKPVAENLCNPPEVIE